MFTDTHCHLNTDAFDADFEEVIERMQKNGVSRIINIGFDLENSKKASDLSKKYDFMYASVGLHPNDAKNFSVELIEKFENLVKNNKKIVAVGETGFDFYRDISKRKDQERSLIAHIVLAKKYNLPLIIHCRNEINRVSTYDEIYAILNENNIKKAIFHCYVGDLDFAKKAWSRGWYTSFSGILTYPKNDDLREIAKLCPDELFLLETDCPYLTPQKYRGKRNEPAFMTETAQCFAAAKNLDLEKIADLEEGNVKSIFGI